MGCFEILEDILEALPLGFKVRNISGEQINPATQETSVDILEKMDDLATEETLDLVKTTIDTLATEATVAAIKTQTDEMTFIEGVLQVSGETGGATEQTLSSIQEDIADIKEVIEAGVHETFYPYYDAGESADLDAQGTTISNLGFYINKTMVGNVGETQVTVALGIGVAIPLPAGASLELTHANEGSITFVGDGTGHVVWVAQGMTEHIQQM